MKIQLLTSSYPAHPDDPTGTAGLFVREFALELARLGHDVVVQPVGRKPAYRPESDVAVIPLPWWGGDRELASMNLLSPLSWLVSGHLVLRGTHCALRVQRERAIDRTLCFWAVPSGIFGLAGKIVRGIPYDIWALGSDIWKMRRIPLLGKVILKAVIRNGGRVYADGIFLAEEIRQVTGVPCRFLPSCRRLPLPTRRMSGADNPRLKHLLFVGRYHVNKGPDLLIRAIACLPPEVLKSTRVRMFGTGAWREGLSALATRLRVEEYVRVEGPIHTQELSNHLASASYLVIPSRVESIPVILSDSLQLGTPVVCTPVGDLGPLVRDFGCGIVSREASAETLASAIREALATDRDSFREGVARASEQFDPGKAVTEWLGAVR